MDTNNSNNAKKILVIEDEPILGEIILVKLIDEGFDAVLVTDGEKGLEKVKEIIPDLILLDLVMPKMGGEEVIQNIKQDENLKNIPIIVISNSGQQSEIESIFELGIKDYVIKAQFNPEDVINKVRKYLSQEYKEKHINIENNSPIKDTNIVPNNIKVLIVEDDKFLSSLVAQKLEKEGFSILSAYDGNQVLKALEENIPDLILLDIIMPEMNGIEVLKIIRSQEKYKNVIILMFSNLGQEHEIEEAKKIGADDYLVKVNYTLKEVVEKIVTHLKNKGKLK